MALTLTAVLASYDHVYEACVFPGEQPEVGCCPHEHIFEATCVGVDDYIRTPLKGAYSGLGGVLLDLLVRFQLLEAATTAFVTLLQFRLGRIEVYVNDREAICFAYGSDLRKNANSVDNEDWRRLKSCVLIY